MGQSPSRSPSAHFAPRQLPQSPPPAVQQQRPVVGRMQGGGFGLGFLLLIAFLASDAAAAGNPILLTSSIDDHIVCHGS